MLDQLLKFGFNKYEAIAYLTLVKQGLISASEISSYTEIPNGRIYNVLASLEKKGFCTVYPGTVKKYKAIDPKVAFKVLIDDQKKSLLEINELQDNLSAEYESLNEDQYSEDYIQVLKSKQRSN